MVPRQSVECCGIEFLFQGIHPLCADRKMHVWSNSPIRLAVAVHMCRGTLLFEYSGYRPPPCSADHH